MGGTTVWCHNGGGMETPVAVGALVALTPTTWGTAGSRLRTLLPASQLRIPAAGFLRNGLVDLRSQPGVRPRRRGVHLRLVARGLRAGRTFSNGPLLELTVNGQRPGALLNASGRLQVAASAVSRLSFDTLQIIKDGEVVAEQASIQGQEARLEREIPVECGGWIAARVLSRTRTHANYPVFAHTSPVYYRVKDTQARHAEAAGAFIDEIEESVRFVRKVYRFASEADLATASGRFEQARRVYGKLAMG